jgi:hypothetical protein
MAAAEQQISGIQNIMSQTQAQPRRMNDLIINAGNDCC